MEKEVLQKLKMSDRSEAVAFLKRLWSEQPTPCPQCGAILTFLHRKAKKSSCDWKCPACGAVYKTIAILNELNGP